MEGVVVMDSINITDAQKWINAVKEKSGFSGQGLKEDAICNLDAQLFPSSFKTIGPDQLVIAKLSAGNALAVIGVNALGFDGIKLSTGENFIYFCLMNNPNAEIIRKSFKFTNPVALSDKDVTFGLGDRLGCASPGHIRLFKNKNAYPVLAQQSVRELDLTKRNYQDVFDSACWAVFQEGYEEPWGADGDHLKTEDWVKTALEIGFTMITADVSDYIINKYNNEQESVIMEDYNKLSAAYRNEIESEYLNLSIKLDTEDTISYTKESLAKIVLIYKDAIDYALTLYNVGINMNKQFDFEFSIDETDTPTLPEAHFFVANEAKKKGIKISSLAPRFIGEFQKGIDYIGNLDEFEESFKKHAAIARYFGYRISVHSGSDKFMVFPSIGKYTNKKFHIKTAGTNWLQSLEIISELEKVFFRKLYKFALEVFPIAREYYHITPNMENVPDIDSLNDSELPMLFKNNDVRQVLHVTYGEILKNEDFKCEFYKIIGKNIESYWHSLEKHIGKHLDLLGIN